MAVLLKLGASGPDVSKLTGLLVAHGLLAKKTAQFDAEVRKAVRAFQSANIDPRGQPLVVDGAVGPLTWWALETADISAVLRTSASPDLTRLPAGGSQAGRAALQAAITEMQSGAKEIGANNSGKWVKKYLNGLAPEGENGSWCAGFVSWCFQEGGGGALPFSYDVGAQSLYRQFRQRGWTYDPATQTPEPGDIVAWWRGATQTWKGHIGLVHHVENGILYTIEGNRGAFPAPVRGFDYVASRMEKLIGFGRAP